MVAAGLRAGEIFPDKIGYIGPAGTPAPTNTLGFAAGRSQTFGNSYTVILKSSDGLALESVIPAKAGIQVLFLGPRFRGDDDQRNQMAPFVESVITFEKCYTYQSEIASPAF